MTSSDTQLDTEDPASLSLYHLMDPAVLANPYPLYQRLRTHDPVHWDPYLYAWIVTRYSDVTKVFLRCSADRTPTPEFFEALGVPEVSPVAELMVRQMLFLDAPAHTRLRKLAGAAFQPVHVAKLREHIQDVADRLIDDVQARGRGADGQARMDMLADFAEPLPAIVTTELLGVPVEDHVKLKDWSVTFAEMLGNFQHNPDRLGGVLDAVENLTAYFHDAIQEQRRHPTEGLVSAFLASEVDGDRLTDEEVAANCIVTMVGGLETTTNLIGNGMLSLLRNPAEQRRLRSEPDIMPSAVEELLRYESPSQHTARIARDDFGAGGDRGDGRRQPRPGAVPRPRPVGPRTAGQPAPGLRLGLALLLRRPARPAGGGDRLQLAAAPIRRLPAGRRTAGLAGQPGAAGAEGATADRRAVRGPRVARRQRFVSLPVSSGDLAPSPAPVAPPRLREATFEDYPRIYDVESTFFTDSLPPSSRRGLFEDNPLWPRLRDSWPIGWVLEDEAGRIVGSLTRISAQLVRGKGSGEFVVECAVAPPGDGGVG
jgi:cytochrome P450